MFLLDTNIVSELTRPKPDLACLGWLQAHTADCVLSTITLAELRYGVERLPEGKKKAEKERAFGFLAEGKMPDVVSGDSQAILPRNRGNLGIAQVILFPPIRPVGGL